jgi:hypothetical protein
VVAGPGALADSESGTLQRGGCEPQQCPKTSLRNSQIAQSSRLTTGAIVQQGLELRSISHFRPSQTLGTGTGTVEQDHVRQSANLCPILQSNFVGEPHVVAIPIPQTSLQVSRPRLLRDNSGIISSGPSGPRELGGRSGSANAHVVVDSPHEENTHTPNADLVEDAGRTTTVQLSGGPSAPSCGTSCVSWSSSFPLGPSVVMKTASRSIHPPRDVSSHGQQPEHRLGRSKLSPFTTATGEEVTHNEQSYPMPTVVPERVPLRLEHTVSAADPPSFSSHILWKGTIPALQLMRTSTMTPSKLRTKYLLRGGQQEQRKSSSMKTSFMIRPGCDVIDMNQILKVTMLRSSCLFLGLPHQMMLLVDERPLAYKGMIPARRILMTLPNHEKAKNVVWRSPRWTCIKLAWCM